MLENVSSDRSDQVAVFIVTVADKFVSNTLANLVDHGIDKLVIGGALYKALETDYRHPQGMPELTRTALAGVSADGAALWWLMKDERVAQSDLKLTMGRQGGEVFRSRELKRMARRIGITEEQRESIILDTLSFLSKGVLGK